MLELRVLPVGEFQSNCYLIVDRASGDAILVDAGADAEQVLEWLADVQVTHLLITHGHPDHVGALEQVRQTLGVPVGVHPADAQAFDLAADFDLGDGDRLALGDRHLQVVHVPGHTPGSVALRLLEAGQVHRAVVGDAIFPGGLGRTETPQDLAASLQSLAGTVFTWQDEVELFPGHGGSTTVGAERAAFEAFRAAPPPPDLCGDVTWR